MRRLGTIVRVTGALAVARSRDESMPEIGTDVIDEELTDVGTVVDVFGPVERPYLAINPDIQSTASLVGNTVYTRAGE